MKFLIIKITVAVLLCVLVLSLTLCNGGIRGEDAEKTVDDFFSAVAADDYDKAQTYLHPEVNNSLKNFLQRIEYAYGIDFSQGLQINEYTGLYYSQYDTEVGGSLYGMSMKATASDKEIDVTILIVKNRNGYGIYNIYVE